MDSKFSWVIIGATVVCVVAFIVVPLAKSGIDAVQSINTTLTHGASAAK
ncbi:hypothetical protein [Burkholderia sp. Ac-20365]|nr:hypothetical protein [Burkholderia sp. Ac-20365]MBN3763400.1 hypothetical protein [Burkholderia sp. Ac-20365]